MMAVYFHSKAAGRGRVRFLPALIALSQAFGCGSKKPSEPSPSNGARNDAGGGRCAALENESVPPSAAHVPTCSALRYATDPPSGGPHYPDWAAFQTYEFPVPHGFLVHALEHGAVVLWYNCPEGCAGEVAQAQAFIDALPEDPLCAAYSARRRMILTPSPTLGTRWAASSWGFTLRSECFDADVFEDFYTRHSGRGLEAFCIDGIDVIEGLCP